MVLNVEMQLSPLYPVHFHYGVDVSLNADTVYYVFEANEK
jgi:hypothetical protein